MYSNSEFGDAIGAILESLLDDMDVVVTRGLVLVKCDTGFHRADTTNKTCVDLLSSFVDGNGDKYFNVESFPLRNARGHRDALCIDEEAIKWTRTPCAQKDVVTAEVAYDRKACQSRDASRCT